MWYDGCFGWVHTVNREQVFQFSNEYMPITMAYFIVAKRNENTFNPDNISGKKFGE